MKFMGKNKYIGLTLFIILSVAVIFFVMRGASIVENESGEEGAEVIASIFRSQDEIAHGNPAKKDVIFTFDGGATVQSGEKILAVLSKHHVKGTFFLTGKMALANPDLVKKIVAGGNEIFNHTYDHKNLTTLTDQEIIAELSGFESVLWNIAHISPKPYFRAPYGSRDARVLAVAKKDGYTSVFWSVDALDWREPRGETADEVKTKILSTVSPGTIYLMHIGDTITGTILDDVFTQIEARGYKIVSVTEGL